MSKAAKVDQMETLHALTCKAIVKGLKDPDPEVQLKAVNSAIKFLKDNHIEAAKPLTGTPIKTLLDELEDVPFPVEASK